MRWKAPIHEDYREIGKFLLLPLNINNDVRWLEYAIIGQKYDGYRRFWGNVKWIDKK